MQVALLVCWAVESIISFNSSVIAADQYKVEVWKALSMNDGVNTLFRLTKSDDVAIQHLASMITELLQLEGTSCL